VRGRASTRPFLFAMTSPQRVFYGGQAVMEGVLMRGQTHASVAVRRPNGTIATKIEPISHWARTPLRRIPFVRGVIILAETLVMGMSALQWSANVALEQEGEELSGRQMALVIIMAIGLAAVLFFATPALLTGWLEEYLPGFLVHILEGVIRILFLLAYLWFIGRMQDVQRLFMYHGAEHKTIHAYEAGLPLDVEHIQPFSPAHPRCGTSFLLTVMVVSVFAFAFLGPLDMFWRVLSRILLLPFIAAVSYEAMRWGATHLGGWWSTLVVGPGLALQKLTTREPEDSQVEVAVTAFQNLRALEGQLPADPRLSGEINA